MKITERELEAGLTSSLISHPEESLLPGATGENAPSLWVRLRSTFWQATVAIHVYSKASSYNGSHWTGVGLKHLYFKIVLQIILIIILTLGSHRPGAL